ncbi:uncharacterized protein LOC100908354 [Galendromus occidentalis]|uniref:Uncharacterized protein LOC100908354 n=1 Tax=Galendromus occidentalis TaxID=34638 RepID=A0AAJ6QPB9_9ACAR|nr:uncharacterized protein LOC100908354 [Galendromus occidentalis]
MNQVITSGAVNRSLTRAYPNDPPPPKSHSSLRVLLSEEATRVRNDLMTTLQQIREKGMKFSMSFDEATLIGTDRYLTVNLHHSDKIFGCSNITPLGLIRVKERATGEYLRDVICHRLSSFELSRNDIVAAVTDGASNVLKAVDLIGVHRQKCFAHGLDLVIRKAVYGAQAAAFDVAILTDGDDRSISRVDSGDDSPEDSDRSDAEDTGNSDDDDERVETLNSVTLGEALRRLRAVARDFRRKTAMMDEVRKITERDEYNGRSLCVKIDCKTRWYSTLEMIERAIEILPAINNVLSRYGTPLSPSEAVALERIRNILSPFKRAILALCKNEATLFHADRVFSLLMKDLDEMNVELSRILLESLKGEIRKRRTIHSSILAVLENYEYDFSLELEVGQERLSDDEILDNLADILDAREFVEDESSSLEMLSQAPTVSWDSIFNETSASSDSAGASSSGRAPSGRVQLNREFSFFKSGGGRGPLLNTCLESLRAIPPTSVQAERDFSTVRHLLGENRARLKSTTLNDIFIIRKALQNQVL